MKGRMSSAFVLVALLAGLASAQTNSSCGTSQSGTLSVTGKSSVTASPDTATVSLGVTSTQPTAVAAQEDVGKSVAALLAALDAVEGIDPEDVTTVGVTLTPKYARADANRPTSDIVGYTFSQMIKVTIANLSSEALSAVVDAAVKSGGNNLRIRDIATTLSPGVQTVVLNKARSQAVDDALKTAKVLAQASGVSIGPIKSLQDQSSAPGPMPRPYAANDRAAAPGESATTITTIADVEVVASVALQVEVCNPPK